MTMKAHVDLLRSTLGRKAVMAVTGFLLFGFVLTHMAGNLKMYLGQEKFDAYAEGLREIGKPLLGHGQALWIARVVLLAAALLHIWSAWSLTMQSRRARPLRYEALKSERSTYAARTMRWGGVILLLFVFYHLAHLTFGWVHPDFVPGKVYQNVTVGLQVWWVAGFYMLANLALGFHLYHGLWSFFQTLGWTHPRFDPWRRRFAALFAIVITLGNLSFPLAVLTGVVR
ncbi:MAG: succinate dehydrogenase cytochrome b subunit [Thermoanaerobaculia bacterium]